MKANQKAMKKMLYPLLLMMANMVMAPKGGRNQTLSDNEIKAKQVLAVATKEQKKVFVGMQSGTEYLFLMYLGKEPITKESIDHTLMIMVNSVEGDVSQLEDEHAEYAKKQGWLKVFAE